MTGGVGEITGEHGQQTRRQQDQDQGIPQPLTDTGPHREPAALPHLVRAILDQQDP